MSKPAALVQSTLDLLLLKVLDRCRTRGYQALSDAGPEEVPMADAGRVERGRRRRAAPQRHGRELPASSADAAECRCPRAADRVRERRQPDARPIGRPVPRDCRSLGAGRRTPPHHPAAADGERSARVPRRRARHCSRNAGSPAAAIDAAGGYASAFRGPDRLARARFHGRARDPHGRRVRARPRVARIARVAGGPLEERARIGCPCFEPAARRAGRRRGRDGGMARDWRHPAHSKRLDAGARQSGLPSGPHRHATAHAEPIVLRRAREVRRLLSRRALGHAEDARRRGCGAGQYAAARRTRDKTIGDHRGSDGDADTDVSPALAPHGDARLFPGDGHHAAGGAPVHRR